MKILGRAAVLSSKHLKGNIRKVTKRSLSTKNIHEYLHEHYIEVQSQLSPLTPCNYMVTYR